MTTYVLMHGGGMGGWCWKFIAPALRAAGHEVFTPTFTGFAERSHLISRGITNATHVTDIVSTLHYYDIKDAVLVAHSYAGTVAPGVVAQAGDRIKSVVYVDAIVVDAGERVNVAMGFMPQEQAEQVAAMLERGEGPIGSGVADMVRKMAEEVPNLMPREREAWMLDHLSDQPLSCTVFPVEVGAGAIDKPVEYITVPQTIMTQMHERAQKLGWKLTRIEGDHACHIGNPEAVTEILLGHA
jgi:pimeloyl-ACP methyl ester carboxylesterase